MTQAEMRFRPLDKWRPRSSTSVWNVKALWRRFAKTTVQTMSQRPMTPSIIHSYPCPGDPIEQTTSLNGDLLLTCLRMLCHQSQIWDRRRGFLERVDSEW